MRILAISLLAMLVFGTTANAQSNIVEVATVDSLKTCCGGGMTPPTNANVDGSASPNDGGGGQFVVAPCGTNATDEGVVIKETGSPFRCWYRQFSGPVHLAWYGVKDAADQTLACYASESAFLGCAADATVSADGATTFNAIANAFRAAAQSRHLGGDGGVVTDGRSIVVYSVDLEIPPNQYFSCSGPPGGLRTQLAQNPLNATPYYTLPNSIVLGPGHTIRRDANSLLHDCIVRPTWYNATQLGLVTSTRTLIDNIEHKFTGK